MIENNIIINMNMQANHLIDAAYDVAVKEFKDNSFTFNELYDSLSNVKEKCAKQTVGEFYTDILQDPRFTFIGEKKWKLREFLKEDEITSIKSNLYDLRINEENAVKNTPQIVDHEIEEEMEEELEEDNEDSETI